MTHITGKIAAYLAGELQEPEAAGVKKHLETCADCRAALDAERAVWNLLGQPPAQPSVSGSGSVWGAVRARTVASGGSSGRLRPVWATAAVAAGILVAAALPGSRGGGGTASGWTAADGDSWVRSTWLDDSGSGDWAEGWLLAGLDESEEGS